MTMTDTVRNVLLEGIVGSAAYGLSTPESDVDVLGVWAVHTEELFGLDAPIETYTTVDPDGCWHEVAKFARLALKTNPTVTELLWLPDGSYTEVTDLGLALLGIRGAFLSASRVRDAYLGYATSQFTKLNQRGDGTFSSDTRARSRKHARHMARLVRQGYGLYTTGELSVDVGADRDWLFEFSEASPEVWSAWFERERAVFASADSVLPESPDQETVVRWLRCVRSEFLNAEPTVVNPHRARSHFGDAPYCVRCRTDWPCTAQQRIDERKTALLVPTPSVGGGGGE